MAIIAEVYPNRPKKVFPVNLPVKMSSTTFNALVFFIKQNSLHGHSTVLPQLSNAYEIK